MKKNNKPAKKNPGGRPTKYKPEYCQMLIDHMSKGYSFESFGFDIKVNQDTLHEWAKVHKEFSESKKMAFIAALKFWEQIGVAGTLGKIKGFNPTSWIFNMKNRFKWTDRSDLAINPGGESDESKEDHQLLKSVDRAVLLKLVKKEKAS